MVFDDEFATAAHDQYKNNNNINEGTLEEHFYSWYEKDAPTQIERDFIIFWILFERKWCD